jgi:D-beta-D-heptose 7-phosphate kinase/D-beta-D-heptose 1-phosphate adenosyltransferase
VLSVIAYGIEKGLDIFQSCKLACFAAARIVEKRGVAVITPKDLSTGIVFTNGVFDILHVGHLKLLKHAKTLGSKLIVGINSDTSVKRIKGDARPINDEFTRKQALEELGFIDEVIIFDEDTPLQTMERVQPDIIVKGGDYIPETVVGNHLAEVIIFPTVEGHSTTNIIGKMAK